MSQPPHSAVPRLNLLTDQTAQWLVERISSGEWREEVPTEAALCRELQVSRVTLRRALQLLADEGRIIGGGRGMRRRIHPDFTKPPVTRGGRIVRVLAPFSQWRMGAVHHAILEGLSHRVDARSLRVEFESRPQLFNSHRPKQLDHLANLPDTAGWVLFFSSAPMQRWFAGKGIPCVVAGRLHDDVDLPCAYPDNEAVAKHAAGMLVARGHRRFAMLIARQTSLGDRLASVAFLGQARALGADARLIEYAGGPGSVCRAMNAVLAARPAPTACFLTCPEDAVTALCHTLRAGIAVPGRLDLLVGWDDPILDHTVPALSHYRFGGIQMGRRIGTLILNLIENRRPGRRETRFLGGFVPGGTLRAAVK